MDAKSVERAYREAQSEVLDAQQAVDEALADVGKMSTRRTRERLKMARGWLEGAKTRRDVWGQRR